jgi:hypothetical protein
MKEVRVFGKPGPISADARRDFSEEGILSQHLREL